MSWHADVRSKAIEVEMTKVGETRLPQGKDEKKFARLVKSV
jgi:hypothetical protein